MAIRRIASGALVVSCGVPTNVFSTVPGFVPEMFSSHEGVTASRLRSGLTCIAAAKDLAHAAALLAEAADSLRPAVVLVPSAEAVAVVGGALQDADVVHLNESVELVGESNDLRHLSGTKVLVGDVHNSWRTLSDMVSTAEARYGEDVLIVSVGDLLNKGGRNSGRAAINTIKLAQELIHSGRMVAIKGNHEHQVAKVLTDGSTTKGMSRKTVEAIRESDAAETLIPETVALIDSMPLWARVDDTTVTAHAGWRPTLRTETSGKAQRRFAETCLWGGSGIWADEYVGDDLVVVGHIIQDTPTLTGNVLRIDTGLYTGGNLTGYVVGNDPSDADSFVTVPLHRKDRREELVAI